MRRPASTCCWLTGGTPASLTCPGIRGCWARSRAGPLMMPRTGWRRPPRPGGTASRSSRWICAPFIRARCGGCCRARRSSWTCFHVVQLAVKMTGDVRRRVVREKYGRRGQTGDAEYGIKGLLVRNLEHLSPARFAKIMDTLGADRHGQEILAAWIAKEKLRDVLNLRARITGSVPCERDVRGRLFRFYDWCAQNDDIPELLTLARTISRWEDEIVSAVLTGSDETPVRKPEPHRETGSPPGLFLPQPREPAPPRPDRLHPRHPPATEQARQAITFGNRPATRSRLTSKSHIR